MPGDRLPAPPRERKPALAALAGLLILVGALGATMLVLRAGDRIEVVKLTDQVSAGQQIPESAITSVLVAEDSSVNYVEWAKRDQLQQDYRTATDLVAGTVLVGEMLTTEQTLPRDEVVLGLSLQPGQFPAGLKPGDTVAAYWVGGEGDERSATDEETVASEEALAEEVLAEEAKVVSVNGASDASGNDTLPVTLRVAHEDAPALARAASANEVALVIVAPAGR